LGEFARDYSTLLVHCVSRPEHENFSDFLHDYGRFEAYCVSRRVPGYFGEGVTAERLADDTDLATQPLAQPPLAVVVRVLLVPGSARSPVPLATALLTPARALSLACTRVRLEPLAAYPARPLARHPLPPAAAAWLNAISSLCHPRSGAVGHFSRAQPGHFSRAAKRWPSRSR